jgi:hypothetical protein
MIIRCRVVHNRQEDPHRASSAPSNRMDHELLLFPSKTIVYVVFLLEAGTLRWDPAQSSYQRGRFAAVFRHFTSPLSSFYALFLSHRIRLKTQHTVPIDLPACPQSPPPLLHLPSDSSPCPWDCNSSHLWASAMSLTKCFPSDLPLEGFGVCTARRRLTLFLRSARCMARGRKILTTSQFQTQGEAVHSQGHHPRRLRLRYFATEARRALSPCPNSCG